MSVEYTISVLDKHNECFKLSIANVVERPSAVLELSRCTVDIDYLDDTISEDQLCTVTWGVEPSTLYELRDFLNKVLP